RVTLRLVVDPARADWVHVAPVALGLRVHLRVSVDLARRGEQEPRALELRQTECVVCPVRARLERQERLTHVVDRARERGEVVDVVDRLVDLDVIGDVAAAEDEFVVPQVLEILERARLEVVDADHAIPLAEQVLAEMGAEKTGSAGHDSGRHHGHRIGRPGWIRPRQAGLTESLRGQNEGAEAPSFFLGYALWMTIEPPAIACGSAVSMSRFP